MERCLLAIWNSTSSQVNHLIFLHHNNQFKLLILALITMMNRRNPRSSLLLADLLSCTSLKQHSNVTLTCSEARIHLLFSNLTDRSSRRRPLTVVVRNPNGMSKLHSRCKTPLVRWMWVSGMKTILRMRSTVQAKSLWCPSVLREVLTNGTIFTIMAKWLDESISSASGHQTEHKSWKWEESCRNFENLRLKLHVFLLL